MEIKKVYKEDMPAVRLVGKRYANTDRDEGGTFAAKWQQWFGEGWFDIVGKCPAAQGFSGDCIGAIRMNENDEFEYWIGIFRSIDTDVPDAFESVEIPAGEIGVCWLYGNDKSGELYSMEASDMSMAAIKKQGWNYNKNGWFFERYNCPRFTTPDENGNVILDICARLV